MTTTLTWETVKPPFREIKRPGIGGGEFWALWFERAWSYLSEAGLADVVTPLDETKVRLGVFTLCWLAHDFCAATFGDECNPYPFWIDWLNELEISPLLALVAATEERPIKGGLSNSAIYKPCSWGGSEERWDFDLEELEGDVKARIGTLAAYRLRDPVVSALVTGFDGVPGLFASLFSCAEYDWWKERRQNELEEHLDDLLIWLEQETDESVRQRLLPTISRYRDMLTPETLSKSVLDELAFRALAEVSQERRRGWTWCEDGFAVTVYGQPEFSGDKQL